MANTTNQSQHPSSQTTGWDLDPNADGDLVLSGLNIAQSQALLVSVTSQDGQATSVSVEWTDGTNTFLTEGATDIGLSGVTNDWARLVRKGPQATVTVTSDAGAGTQNRVNVFADTHR